MTQLVNRLIAPPRHVPALLRDDHAAQPKQGDCSPRVTRDELVRLFATDLAAPRPR